MQRLAAAEALFRRDDLSADQSALFARSMSQYRRRNGVSWQIWSLYVVHVILFAPPAINRTKIRRDRRRVKVTQNDR